MGRKLKIGDYVLLPKGSHGPPYDGFLYAEISDTCQVEPVTSFNGSVRKKRVGYRVKVFTDREEPLYLDIAKSRPLIQFSTTELEKELEERPKECLGMYVGKGLLDKSGKTYLNYGQVTRAFLRKGSVWCNVKFRKLSNGDQLTDLEFSGDDLLDLEVSKLQFALGLGVDVPFENVESRVPQFRAELDAMTRSDTHDHWIQKFKKIVPAHSSQRVTDQFLESEIIDIASLIGDWDVLSRYLTTNEVTKNLSVDFNFNTDNEAFGECITGPPTPYDQGTSSTLQSQNERRQEFRGTSQEPLQPSKIQNNMVVNRVAVEPVQVEDLKQGLKTQVEVQPVAMEFQNLRVSNSGQVASPYSKHSYHPSNTQLQKHSVTFKIGAYGKSHSAEEATSGIEEVLMEEIRHSVKTDEAYIRAYCIMMGELPLAPFWVWRNPTLMANNFEENYLPKKWTKLPELKPVDVVDIDEFYTLYHSMEDAANRYYVHSYGALLAKIGQNMNSGFLVVGGRPGFQAMRVHVRKNVIHILVAYMRQLVNKFLSEVLLGSEEVLTWMAREATTNSPVFDQNVRMRLTTLQLTELVNRAAGNGGGGHGGGGNMAKVTAKEEGGWTSTIPKELRNTIPKANGINICLLSYTKQGCKKKNAGCNFSHKEAGSPSCPQPLQDWIKETYGSYAGP